MLTGRGFPLISGQCQTRAKAARLIAKQYPCTTFITPSYPFWLFPIQMNVTSVRQETKDKATYGCQSFTFIVIAGNPWKPVVWATDKTAGPPPASAQAMHKHDLASSVVDTTSVCLIKSTFRGEVLQLFNHKDIQPQHEFFPHCKKNRADRLLTTPALCRFAHLIIYPPQHGQYSQNSRDI